MADTSSGSCVIAGIGIKGVEPLGSVTVMLVLNTFSVLRVMYACRMKVSNLYYI